LSSDTTLGGLIALWLVNYTFRRARPDEADALSALALRSKAHWGYDQEFIAACQTELTWSCEDIASRHCIVAEHAGDLCGFFVLTGAGEHGDLTDMFVEPRLIGAGLGGDLMRLALQHARDLGYATLGIDADPNAAGFYQHFGASLVSQTPSGSIPGRMLPHLEIPLT